MTQKQLQYIVLGLIGVAVFAAILMFDRLRDGLFSLVLALIILIVPFWSDSLIRYKLIPFIDSLNTVEEQYNNFPAWMRVIMWAFFGIVVAIAWSYLMPVLVGLPFAFGRIAIALGAKTSGMSDNIWQWGWVIIFLIQYFINFFVGWMVNSSRFDYPDE